MRGKFTHLSLMERELLFAWKEKGISFRGIAKRLRRLHTTSIVSIGLPGVAEQLMTDAGFVVGPRTSLKLHWEFPDAELAARTLASTGPAYLAIEHLGIETFMEAATGFYIEGVGIRTEVEVQFLVGFAPD